jgi:hypothetical protein
LPSGRLSGFLHHPFTNPWTQRGSERDSWPETVATVADCLNLSGMLDKGQSAAALYSVRFTYWVDGVMHTGCFKTRTRYAPGDTLMVRHDPRRHECNSTDPEEKLRTACLAFVAAMLPERLALKPQISPLRASRSGRNDKSKIVGRDDKLVDARESQFFGVLLHRL